MRWCTPLIPALGRQRQVDLCEFEASLVYQELVPGQDPKLQRNLVSKDKKKDISLWYILKTELRGKLIALSAYIKDSGEISH